MKIDEAINVLRWLNPPRVNKKSFDDFKQAIEMAIDALEQAKTNCSEIPNNWVPCSERQPDVNGWYITTINGEICGQDRAFSGMSEFANGKWTGGDDVDETEMTIAWMPLPECYQEGEQE